MLIVNPESKFILKQFFSLIFRKESYLETVSFADIRKGDSSWTVSFANIHEEYSSWNCFLYWCLERKTSWNCVLCWYAEKKETPNETVSFANIRKENPSWNCFLYWYPEGNPSWIWGGLRKLFPVNFFFAGKETRLEIVPSIGFLITAVGGGRRRKR